MRRQWNPTGAAPLRYSGRSSTTNERFGSAFNRSTIPRQYAPSVFPAFRISPVNRPSSSSRSFAPRRAPRAFDSVAFVETKTRCRSLRRRAIAERASENAASISDITSRSKLTESRCGSDGGGTFASRNIRAMFSESARDTTSTHEPRLHVSGSAIWPSYHARATSWA